MVKNLLSLLLLIQTMVTTAQTSYDSILIKNDWRTFLLHLPKAYNNSHTYPLVIGLHGGGGKALQFAYTSELSEKADSAGFIIVYPEGKKNPGALGARTWNAGYCCASNAINGTDDVGFIDQLITTLISTFPIDTARIYATGHSNGGMMCYRLAAELSDKIAAIAVSSGTLTRNYPFSPRRPVPIIHFHSYKDLNVPYYGGAITGVVPPVHSPPIDSVMNVWAVFNACTILNDTVHKSSTYNEVVFKNGKCKSELNLYITYDGGHAWPGGKPGGGVDSDTPSTAINANFLLWNFFQRHTLACPSTGISQVTSDQRLVVFPNPVTEFYNLLSVQLPSGWCNIRIYDGTQRIVKSYLHLRGTIALDISTLSNGFYLIEAVTEEGTIKQKFIKQ